MPDVPLIILEVEVAVLSAEISVNGVPLSDSASVERLSFASRINSWVISGANSVKVRLGSLPPQDGVEEDQQPAFELKVRRAIPGTPDEADQVLASYVWQAATQPLPGTARIPVFETSIPLNAVQAWSWTRGYAFTALTPADRAGVANLLGQLRQGLADRQIDAVVGLQTTQVGEQAIAVGEAPERLLGRYREFLGERTGSSDWRVAAFDAEGMQIVGMADGRIQHVTDAAGRPPIVATSGDSRFAIDPYLSRIDGVWTIVR